MKPRLFSAARRSFALAGSIAALLAAPSAQANNTWDGDAGGSFLWSNPVNWGSDTPPVYGTLTFSGSIGTTNVNDSITSMNGLLWTGTSAWTLNNSGGTILSLFDLGGSTPAKIENQSSGLVTINAPITFAATAGPVWGEINAVNGGITFGSGTLTVNGSQVQYIKMFGGGQTTTFNNTVSATGKAFYTTSGSGMTMAVGGAFTSGDIFIMNGSTLRLNSGGSITTSQLRLGGDFGTTLTQNLALGATFALTNASGGQSFSSGINTVGSNTSNALLIDSQNTSGTNTISSAIALDSGLRIQQAAGGSLTFSGGSINIKAQTLTVQGAGTTTINEVLGSSLGAGGSLVKTGAGTLILQGITNNYTGTTAGTLNANGTQINQGTLGIYGDLSLGVAPTSAYNNIQFTGSATLQDTANNITLAATRNISIAAGATATFDSLANTFTIPGVISGATGVVTKIGTGTLTLNGAAVNTFAGGLNANGGTLILDYSNLSTPTATTPTNLIAATNALQINNATLTITGKSLASTTTAQTFAGTTLGAGINTVNIAKGALGTSATLTLGALTLSSISLTTFSPTTAWTTVASATERVFISAGGSVNGSALVLPSGANTAFVNAGMFHRVAGGAAGSLRLAAVNSSGQLLDKANAANVGTATSGVLTDATASYQWNSSVNTTLTNTSATAYGLLLNGNSDFLTLTLAAGGTLTINSIIQIKSAQGLTFAPGSGTSNIIIGAERNLVIAMDNSSFVAITAPIANNGSTGGTGGTASALTIAGTSPGSQGAVTLGGANTYSGATTITRGTLALGNASALSTTSGLTLGGASAATLTNSGDINNIVINGPITAANSGITSTIAYGRTTSAQGSISLLGGITGGGGNVTFTTVSTSSGGNVQTIVLGGGVGSAGAYGGSTTITTGNVGNSMTLRSGIANALPTTTVLTFAQNNGSGSGRTTTFDLNGNNQTLAGLSNTGVVPENRNMTVTSGSAATLTINSTANHTFGGRTISTVQTTVGTNTRAQIAGAISLIKNGAGTFTLGGTLAGGAVAAGNTFTGSTQILAGILVLGETLSIQSSAFDTGSVLGDTNNGLRAGIGGTGVTTLTLGGLTGGNSFASRFTSTTGGYTGLTDLTLNPGTGVTHTYSGDVGNGAGAMALTKSGAGTHVLSGTNTHTGGTNISAGTLSFANGALGTTGNITFTGNSTLQWNGANTQDISARLVMSTGVTSTLDTNNNNVTLATGFGSSSTGALTKVGSGILTLSGINTYSGATTIASGGGTLRLENIAAVSASSGVTLLGTGANATVLQFATNTPFAGFPQITHGFSSSSGGTIVSDRLTTGGGLVQVLGNASLGNVQINFTQGSLVNDTGAAGISLGNVTFDTSTSGGSTTFNPTTANLIITGTVAGGASALGSHTMVLGGTSLGNLVSGNITNGSRPTQNLTKSGISTWVLSGTGSNYNGATTISGGTLAGIGANAFGNTTGISIAAASSATLSLRGDASTNFVRAIDSVPYSVTTTANGATINVDAATGVTTPKTMTIGTLLLNTAITNGTTFTGANNTSLSIGAVTTGNSVSGTETLTNSISSSGTLTLASVSVLRTTAPTLKFDGAGNTTVTGAITESAPTALTKEGAGTLTLTGSNSYTGTTTVTLGTLKLDRAAADNNTIATDGLTATTSDILINGGTLELAASEQIANTGSINMTSGAFNFGAATGKTETIDKFSNSGGAFTTGANTLIGLGATITWSGGTNTVSAGGNVQDGHIVISGGTNTVEGGATGGVLELLSTSPALLEMSAGSTLTLNSDNGVAGKLLLRGNVSTSGDSTVTIASGLALTNKGNIDLDGPSARTFTVAEGAAATDLAISAVITNGALTKAGAGTMALTAVNTYTGTTLVSNGTLSVDNNNTTTFGKITGSAAAASITVNNGGTLLLAGAGNNDRIANAAGVTLAGGTLGLAAGVNVSEGVAMEKNAGVLTVGTSSVGLGLLTLSANSTLDFGTGGVGTLVFTTFAPGAFTLNILNYTSVASGYDLNQSGLTASDDRLIFQHDISTAGFLNQITFNGVGASQISLDSGYFEIVPVPEPSSVATVMGLLGLVGWRERQRGQRARRVERLG